MGLPALGLDELRPSEPSTDSNSRSSCLRGSASSVSVASSSASPESDEASPSSSDVLLLNNAAISVEDSCLQCALPNFCVKQYININSSIRVLHYCVQLPMMVKTNRTSLFGSSLSTPSSFDSKTPGSSDSDTSSHNAAMSVEDSCSISTLPTFCV